MKKNKKQVRRIWCAFKGGKMLPGWTNEDKELLKQDICNGIKGYSWYTAVRQGWFIKRVRIEEL